MFATLALATATVLRVAGPRVAKADQRNFLFMNVTGHQIDRTYVSPHESGTWGPGVLGNSVLPNGTEPIIVFPSYWETSCSFDFKLEFHDGSVETYTEGRNVCNLTSVEFGPYSSAGF
jgi:hypothetical protein